MISLRIKQLVDYAVSRKLIAEEDRIYVTNSLLGILGVAEYEEPEGAVAEEPLETILGAICDFAAEKGLIEEAKAAFDRNLSHTSGAVQAIGHKELFPYFKGEIPLEECVENLKRATRRYAKRQITWFSRDERINWIYADECDDAVAQALKLI